MTTSSTDALCPECQKRIGDHTIDGWGTCCEAAGLDYQVPYEEVPGGPLRIATGEQIMVGEVTVKAGWIDATIGRFPTVVFTFYGPGLDPMSKVPTPDYALVGDAEFLLGVKQIVCDNIDAAIRGVS